MNIAQKRKKVIQILAHIAGWVVFFKLTLPAVDVIQTNPLPFVANILFLTGYFYFNKSILAARLLSQKKVLTFVGLSLICSILICVVLPSLTIQLYGFPEPPFPRPPYPRPLQHDLFTPQGLMSRWRMYSARIHNPTTQFLLVFIISTGLEVLTQWYREQQQLLELEKARMQAELSFLRSQIHPHFLFNCLNSIYYMTLSKDDKAPQVILSLSDILRFVITESNANAIPLEKEITMLGEYLNLQSLRTTEKFELKFEVEGTSAHHSIMPLTFIPFVENAFKYGISAHTPCHVHIRVEIENRNLIFTCINSIAPTAKRQINSAGVGLENIRKRLQLAYPDRHTLYINEENEVFSVKLKIENL